MEEDGQHWFVHISFSHDLIHLNPITVKTLNRKLKRAEIALKETGEAFEGLNDGLSIDLVSKWEKAERKAMEKRGRYLKFYDVQNVKGL